MARFLRHGVVVLAAVLFSIQVSAATLTPITDPGTGAKIYVPSASGLGQSRTITATAGVEPSGSVKLPATIKKNFLWPRVGSSVKTIVKGSPQAIVGTVALGWLLDQIPDASYDNGQFSKLPTPAPQPVTYWTAERPDGSALLKRYAGSGDACRALAGGYPAIYLSGTTSPTRYECHGTYQSGSSGPIQGYVQKVTYNCDYGADANYACLPPPSNIQRVPFTDVDFDSLVSNVPDIPTDMWSEFGPAMDSVPGTFDGPDSTDFTGPESVTGTPTTTTTTDSTGNTTVTESTPSYNFDYSSNPLSITSTTTNTTTTYQNGVQTSTSVTTTSPTPSPVETPLESPTDCDFMPTVCSFIDWVKQPFNEQSPDFSEFTEDKDFAKSITVTGNAICPSPTIIATSHGDFEFSWEPACQWADMIKPLVIIAALLGAIYISLGIGRSD